MVIKMIGRSDEASVVVAGARVVVGAKVVVNAEMVAFATALSFRCIN